MVLRRATFYHKPLAREDHSVWHRVRYRVNLYYEERTGQDSNSYIYVTHDLESIAAGVSCENTHDTTYDTRVASVPVLRCKIRSIGLGYGALPMYIVLVVVIV